jgi:hypothetical protein
VRRRGVHEPRVGGNRRHVNAFRVDRHAAHAGAERGEQLPRQWVTRFLDGNARPRLDQHPRDEVQGLLGAARDQHLRGRHPHGPGQPDVPRDLGP